MKRYFVVRSAEIARNAANAVLSIRPDTDRPMVVEIKEMTRNLDQNALLHSVLTEISNQVVWSGKKFTVSQWKRLCTASWLRESGCSPILVPALDGNGFDIIFEQTSKLSITQCSSLIEWCFAFGAENNVKFNR